MHYPNALLSAAHELSLHRNQTCLRIANNRDDTTYLQGWFGYSSMECIRRVNEPRHTYPYSLHAWRHRVMHRHDARESQMYLGKPSTSTDCTYERLRSDNQRLLALKRFADI